MDLGSTIIGAIMMAICFMPFILMSRSRKKKRKQILQSLTEVAKRHNCLLGQHEFCGDFIIGFDQNTNFVFFFKQKKEEAISQFVDLSEIQSCQAIKSIRSIKNNRDNVSFIERVELSYIPMDKYKAEIKFELYCEENTQLSGELQLVDKWVEQINDRLRNKKQNRQNRVENRISFS